MTKEERHELYKTILKKYWDEEYQCFWDGLCILIVRETHYTYEFINEENFPELFAVKPPGKLSCWWFNDLDRKAALEKMIELSK